MFRPREEAKGAYEEEISSLSENANLRVGPSQVLYQIFGVSLELNFILN